MHSLLRIGTRGSQLALWQARTVAARLESAGVDTELVIIKTTGDRLQSAPISELGTKRLFVKEIEDALLGDDIDVAVHSAKDMPAVLPDGLTIAATLPREDPRDAFVLPPASRGDVASAFAALGRPANIGTGSVRRIAQLSPAFPGAAFTPIRGNVDTRLRKLDAGEYDALVLAVAGLRRLGFGERITATIPARQCLPAPGQGIIAVEVRGDDEQCRRALQAVHDAAAAAALEAERRVVSALGGGCQLPLGALATISGTQLELQAVVCSPDGRRVVRAQAAGPLADPVALGDRVAGQLSREGAVEILDQVRRES
jgi:hydroxymethylbilane synthase